jgi:cytochrome c biogenesis protein CcmG, thiol:disulfide interchange protein DsbE
MSRFLLPLSIFIVLAAFLGIGLRLNPREVPSPLIDKPAPAFRVAQLHDAGKTISPEDMRGKVWLLNVWASWCVACRQEHPILVELAKRNVVPIVGLNYKDGRDAAQQWLRELGDPYQVSAFDADGRIGIDYGVYGVPETFLIDRQGIIRYKHIGPVTPKAVEESILPKIRELGRN